MLLRLLLVLVFFLGVALGSLIDFVPRVSWSIILVSTLFVFPRALQWKSCVWILLSFFIGMLHVSYYESQQADFGLEDSWVNLEGEIVEEVDKRQDHQKIIVETEEGRVLVKVNAYQDLSFGDQVSISGILEKPSEDIEGFNYAQYLARYRIWLVMNEAWVDVIEPADLSWRAVLYDFKEKVEGKLNQLFFEPEASFAAGLLLGSRKGMPKELADAFQVTGLTHIVAISGYNITLVIALIFLIFSFVPFKWRIVLSSFAIFFFVILVGASAAVVRAGIMGVLTLWALFSGQKSQVYFALIWSAVIMILMNPYTLLFDVGFQLSFASTLGLLVFSPMIEQWIPKWERAKVLHEAFILTLAAQVGTLPIILFHFGRLSLISPLANVLVAPFLPLAMLFSALSLILGEPALLLAWFNLWIVEQIALTLAKLPYIDLGIDLGLPGFVLICSFLVIKSLKFYKYELGRALGLCREEGPQRLLVQGEKRHETL